MVNIWLSRGLTSLICSICNFHGINTLNMEDFHGGFHPTHAVKAELGDPHYGFPPGKLVPACHTTSPPWKILGLAHCLNKVMKNSSLSASWRTQVSRLLFCHPQILAVTLRLGSSRLQDGCLCSESPYLHKCMPRQEGQASLPVSFYWDGSLSQKCLSLFISQDWVRSQTLTAGEAGNVV